MQLMHAHLNASPSRVIPTNLHRTRTIARVLTTPAIIRPSINGFNDAHHFFVNDRRDIISQSVVGAYSRVAARNTLANYSPSPHIGRVRDCKLYLREKNHPHCDSLASKCSDLRSPWKRYSGYRESKSARKLKSTLREVN